MAVPDSVHLQYLTSALDEARKSPPKPTNFRVGCVIVSIVHDPPLILSTGYTLELPGNTHAEQCALTKLGYTDSEKPSSSTLPPALGAVLYTTLEPCGKRLSGNLPCVQRIIATRKRNPEGGIRKVIFGAKEPGTFVQDSQSCRMLTEAAIEWEYIPGLDNDILSVAMEGHDKQATKEDAKPQPKQQIHEEMTPSRGTNVDAISSEERKRQETMPRNPKKRMMEAPSGGS